MMFDGEWSYEWGNEERINKFVFIGKELNEDEMRESFMKCIV